MKLHNTVKKLSAIIMVFAMMFSVFAMSGSKLAVKAASNPVKMYCCDMEGSYHGTLQYSVYIQVDASSAANKAVSVIHFQISPVQNSFYHHRNLSSNHPQKIRRDYSEATHPDYSKESPRFEALPLSLVW